MRRWTLAPNFGKAEMVPDPDGEYVALSDIEKVVEELEEEERLACSTMGEDSGAAITARYALSLLRKALSTEGEG